MGTGLEVVGATEVTGRTVLEAGLEAGLEVATVELATGLGTSVFLQASSLQEVTVANTVEVVRLAGLVTWVVTGVELLVEEDTAEEVFLAGPGTNTGMERVEEVVGAAEEAAEEAADVEGAGIEEVGSTEGVA